jgi:hypothetical protein
MPMYEVELRRPGKPREVRLGNRPLTPGETLTIENELWRVLRAVKPENTLAEARYICSPLRLAPRLGASN